MKTADKSFALHPVSTVHNVADIGTKTLSGQRLSYLLHECGLVYGVDFSDVGEQWVFTGEFLNERLVNAQQLKKIYKAIMGFAMGITEGLESRGAMGQQCNSEEIQTNKFAWIFTCVFSCIWVVVVFAIFWRRVQNFVKRLESDVDSVQTQLGDHYEYAGGLGNRLDSVDVRCESIDESLDAQAARVATLQEEMVESSLSTEEAIDCLRLGLMEFGGFVPNTFLSREQRAQMFVQKRANLVLWNLRNRADTADATLENNLKEEKKIQGQWTQ